MTADIIGCLVIIYLNVPRLSWGVDFIKNVYYSQCST